MLSEEKMSEAEVSLRLAFHLLRHNLVVSDVSVAIDGAQIKTLNEYHFHITEFLEQNGCRQCEASVGWSGAYSLGCSHHMIIHSNPGKGDVVAQMKSGHELRVESKKGPLVRTRSSAEYPLLREALGQLITIESVDQNDILAVAVPKSEKFESLATRWREAPLIKKAGIRILTVARDGTVNGLETAEPLREPDRQETALTSR
ncbi:MAG: hypothetical protein WCJ37_09170 [Syntrophus sp. (in: bacteria)]